MGINGHTSFSDKHELLNNYNIYLRKVSMTPNLSIRNPLLFTIAIFSSLFGFSGIEHGFFEILQGNTKTSGSLISAIGPVQKYWLHGTETAFTIIPEFLTTGIVTIVISFCVIMWSLLFMKNRYSWIILLFLSIAQFLTGGGFAQIFLSVILSITAAGLYRPRIFWNKYVSVKIRSVFSKLWNYSFFLFIIIFLSAMEMAVFGFPYGNTNPEITYKIMMISSYMMIILFFFTLVFAYSKDSMITKTNKNV
jgi:hypothetical protein